MSLTLKITANVQRIQKCDEQVAKHRTILSLFYHSLVCRRPDLSKTLVFVQFAIVK